MSDTNPPPISIPKKRAREDVGSLIQEKGRIDNEVKEKKKKLKAHGSFNVKFWSTAHEVESLILERTHVERKISLADFGGHPARWQQTDEARTIFSRIRAQEHRVSSFGQQANVLAQPKRNLREVFMGLFTTSPMGLNIKSGSAQRNKSIQSNFRDQLIKDQNAQHDNGRLLWCPVLHEWVPNQQMKAGHLFPCIHGQATMDAIFGATNPPELFSTRNGLLLFSALEDNFDKGVLVIVPDLPDPPPRNRLAAWLKSPTREYKLRIIDTSWELIDDPVHARGLAWRQLDGRRLLFRSEHRPAARYLYFHYCIQVLRRAWKAGGGQKTAFGLHDEHGKLFWGTPGRYMAKNMLRALTEELGHEYEPLLQGGNSFRPASDRSLLLNTAAAQIASPDSNDADNEEEEEDGNESDCRDSIS